MTQRLSPLFEPLQKNCSRVGSHSLPEPRPSNNNMSSSLGLASHASTAADVLKQLAVKHGNDTALVALDAATLQSQQAERDGEFTFAGLAQRGELARQFVYSKSHQFPLRSTSLDAHKRKQKIAKLKHPGGTLLCGLISLPLRSRFVLCLGAVLCHTTSMPHPTCPVLGCISFSLRCRVGNGPQAVPQRRNSTARP